MIKKHKVKLINEMNRELPFKMQMMNIMEYSLDAFEPIGDLDDAEIAFVNSLYNMVAQYIGGFEKLLCYLDPLGLLDNWLLRKYYIQIDEWGRCTVYMRDDKNDKDIKLGITKFIGVKYE